MATKKTTGSDFLSATQAEKDALQRTKTAAAQRKKSSVLLNPNEVSGDYDASRLLMTTLGGDTHTITPNDLAMFRRNAKALGSRFKGGITPRQVIDLSLKDRRDRANSQIKLGIPIAFKGGRVKFQTNAGPLSKEKRHYVVVDFLDYTATLASPIPSIKIAPELIKGKVKMDCSCEDWQYRYRYLATIAKYAAGPTYETAYTKVTNPMLEGIACKHIIRVMSNIIQSPTFKGFLSRMIDVGRKEVTDIERKASLADIKVVAEQLKKENYAQRAIKTTAQKQLAQKKRTAVKRAEKRVKNKDIQKELDKINKAKNQESALQASLKRAEIKMSNIPGLSVAAIKASLKIQEKELRKSLNIQGKS